MSGCPFASCTRTSAHHLHSKPVHGEAPKWVSLGDGVAPLEQLSSIQGWRAAEATRVKTIYKGGFGQPSKILDSCNTVLGSGAGFFPFMHFFWQMNCCRLWKSSARNPPCSSLWAGLLPASKPRCPVFWVIRHLATPQPQPPRLERARSHWGLVYVWVRLEWALHLLNLRHWYKSSGICIS